jgi:phenylalanyl-tRNA synthetase beta chain
VDRKRGPFKKRSVWISPERASALIGVRFTPSGVGAILKRLGLSLETRRGERLRFSVPTFRPDLQRDVDLMEEVARLYGYDRIPETVPLRPMECRPLNGEYVFQEEIRSALIGLGLSEAITFSFSSPREPERLGLPADHPGRALVEILNPVNKEQGSLRNTLLPGLLRVVAHNQNRGVESAALFELGTVFFPRPGEAVPREEIRLGIALSRPGEDMSWRRRDPSPDFYTLKGLIEALLTSLGLDGVEFAAEEHPSFRPGQTAGVVFRGEKIATAGTITDAVLEAYALSGPVFMAEIALAPLLGAREGSVRYRPLPIYPAVRRDIAIIVRNSVSYAEIRNAIESLRPELLEEYRLFDVYRGEPIPPGEKSLAFSLHYRSRCDTLQEAAVAAVHAAFKEALARKLACRFRE